MKFEEWFVIQCGKDPAPGKTPFELWREVKACRNELGRLELLANDKANWESMEYAARLAWNLSDEYKKGKKV